ncbi:MAG: hypothetical protein AAF152_02435 [Cyanobacteria bacterium P01_A01_bin.114]
MQPGWSMLFLTLLRMWRLVLNLIRAWAHAKVVFDRTVPNAGMGPVIRLECINRKPGLGG